MLNRKWLGSVLCICLVIVVCGTFHGVCYASGSDVKEVVDEEKEYGHPAIKKCKISEKKIELLWDECQDVDYYEIVYKIGKKVKEVKETEKNKLTIKNLSLANGEKIQIKVKALYEKGESTESLVSYYYSSPKLLTVTSKESKRINIKWSKNSKCNAYEVRIKKSGGKVKTVVVNKKTEYLMKAEGDKNYQISVRGIASKNGEKYYTEWSDSKKVKVKYDKWDKLLDQYTSDKKTNQLVFVKHHSSSYATVEFYVKKNGKFKKVFSENGYVGRNGIDKVKEGDKKTPTGTFALSMPFGIKADPGSKQKYIKVDSNMYWCGDKEHYNTLINIKKYPHSCRGEHLINFGRAYYYCMFIEYNKEGIWQKGSAIFLHCTSGGTATAGCVAISEEHMKTVLRETEKGAKICIYRE